MYRREADQRDANWGERRSSLRRESAVSFTITNSVTCFPGRRVGLSVSLSLLQSFPSLEDESCLAFSSFCPSTHSLRSVCCHSLHLTDDLSLSLSRATQGGSGRVMQNCAPGSACLAAGGERKPITEAARAGKQPPVAARGQGLSCQTRADKEARKQESDQEVEESRRMKRRLLIVSRRRSRPPLPRTRHQGALLCLEWSESRVPLRLTSRLTGNSISRPSEAPGAAAARRHQKPEQRFPHSPPLSLPIPF